MGCRPFTLKWVGIAAGLWYNNRRESEKVLCAGAKEKRGNGAVLRLIFGRSGSGKTRRIRELAGRAAKRGGQVFVVVPEQFSFESERALYRELGAQTSLAVEVLSFTRLANLVFRACGGLAKQYVDDCARRLLMSIALDELKDRLEVYRRHRATPAFIKSMLDVVAEFKNAGVSPALLAAAGEAVQGQALAKKTGELALIYDAYEALLARGYADPLDDLPAANRLLEQHDLFAGTYVFVDEFKGFTAVELQTLRLLVKSAAECTVALCAEGLSDNERGMGLFSPVVTVANKLVRLAKEQGVSVATPEHLSEQHRFATPALCAAERLVFAFNPAPADCPADGVELYCAKGPYEELELVAARISELVREDALRYRDIVVIARDAGRYQTALESVFERFDIPYFLDRTRTVEHAPLFVCALSAVECAAGGFGTDSLLALLKTGLADAEALEVAALENYAFVWDLKSGVWQRELTAHPRGFEEEWTERDKETLARINALRERVMAPLVKLAHALRETTGEGFARAVYQYLTDARVDRELARQIEADRQARAFNAAQETARVWDVLMGILDTFSSVLGAQGMSARRALELFWLAAGSYDMGDIPQTLDQVLVGSAGHIRAAEPKAVFLIGANEGIFPMAVQSGGLLSDGEREALIGQGLALSGTREQKAVEERFIAYKALTGASQRLIVSYPRAGVKGDALYPSVIVRRLAQIFPALDAEQPCPLREESYVVNHATVLAAAARRAGENSPFAASLGQLLGGQGIHFEKTSFSIEDLASARALFGEELLLSPTGLETFYRCRFSYFLRYGIRLKKRERARLSPTSAGSLIHYALQQLLSQYTVRQLADLSPEQRKTQVKALLADYLDRHMGGSDDKPARFTYLFARLAATVERLLARLIEELLQSEFVPDAFELPIQKGGEVEPVELVTPSGARVLVQGQVDRVDVMARNGRRYIRVVDYKSGKKSFNLSDVYYGLNMQMLLYLFTLGSKGRYGGSIPAGVLYMPAHNPPAEVERDADDEALRKKKAEQLKMSGLLIDDPEVLLGMEKDGRGVFIPAKVVPVADESGQTHYEVDHRSRVASLEDMGKLHRHIDRLVRDMAVALHAGEIDAVPVSGGDYSPCEYCEFAQVCGHEEDDPVTEVLPIPQDELFARLEAQSDDA